VRGLAVRPLGALVNAVTALKNTPFSNSIEVNAEATAGLWGTLDASGRMMRLASLVVSAMRPEPDAVRAFVGTSQITMTAVADLLVARAGLPFRTAHDVVACALGHLESRGPIEPRAFKCALEMAADQLGGACLNLDVGALTRALDPEQVVLDACFGGGPSPIGVRPQIARLADRVSRLAGDLDHWHRRLDRARDALDDAMASVLRS